MANKILTTILDSKITRFIREFCDDAPVIFLDENKKLIHPGEYGIYRENICKDFLRDFIPKNRDISTGFILNNLDEVSTQCDLVIYDKSNTPIFNDERGQKFFPVETIASVGEIKSNLSKTNFTNAIDKLAKVKEMRLKSGRVSIFRDQSMLNTPADPELIPYDQLTTFLICRKFDFKYTDLIKNPEKYFKCDSKLRPNLILSLEDGLFAYKDMNGRFLYYPSIPGQSFPMVKTNSKNPIRIFGAYIYAMVTSTTIFHPDIVSYI